MSSVPRLLDRQVHRFAEAPPLRCLVSSVHSDAHTWSLVLLQLELEEAGHEVVNLGSCPPDTLVLSTCRRVRPELLVLSTTNGHGHVDAVRLIRLIREDPELGNIRAVIGGKLTCDASGERAAQVLRLAGFDAVFTNSDDLGAFHGFVQRLAAS